MTSLLSFSVTNSKMMTVRATAAASPSTITVPESLTDKFGRKGINFFEYDNTPFVELAVRNGSSLKLQIPNAHVTSYKPKVYWKDDGFEEILYTIPGKGNEINKAKGGIGLVLNDVSQAGTKGSLVSTSEWTVNDVDSDSIDAVQVELSSTSGSLDITYVVTLYPVSIATAVKVKNNGRKDVTLTSAILSHLKFKSRSGAAIQGLKGCNYSVLPSLSSPFEILSPNEALKADPSPGWFSSEPAEKQGSWTEQDVPYTILKHKVSRVYAAPPKERLKPFYNTPPSKYEILDQGKELFFRVIRMGFEDIYLGSPGSLSEKYGNEYFVCTGPASVLVPVDIKPGEEWRGAQVIEHDNL